MIDGIDLFEESKINFVEYSEFQFKPFATSGNASLAAESSNTIGNLRASQKRFRTETCPQANILALIKQIDSNMPVQQAVLDQKKIQPLIEAICNNDLTQFSDLLKNIDINSYYKDGFDEDGEGTLISMALLNACFYFGNKSFINKIISNKPNADLAISYDNDGYSSETLKSWLLTEKQEIEANIADPEEDYDWFELNMFKDYLSKINVAIAGLKM